MTTRLASRRRSLLSSIATGLSAVALASSLHGQGPKFYPDDPLQREPETQDASKARPWDIPLTPDLVRNLFGKPGDPALNVRAQNINTADEVPDSSWFTNRIYAREVTPAEITKGPNTIEGVAPGRLTIIRPKAAGTSPGFTARDANGETWFIAFDAKDNPIAPTAAHIVATKLFWAMGYNQVETYLVNIRPEELDIDPGATVNSHGARRRFSERDLNDVFARAARSEDGSYRAVAGRAVPGKVLGGFRYFGTRPDDPNDIVPHEHRRELRALKVFGAWTNLVDMKAGNTLDTVIEVDGRGIVKHYLQDVGSTFGTGALHAREGDEGYEHLVDIPSTLKRLFTFGLFMRPWQTLDYKEHPEVGRFEGEVFDPEEWRPRVPVAALRHARPDDTFWAALRVMAFSDDLIRAAVKAGGYTDPAAEDLLASILQKRRDKIGRVYFSRVNPLTGFSLSNAGELTYHNPAVRAGFEQVPAKGYQATWARFDNVTRDTQPIGEATATGDSMRAPGELPGAADAYVKISIRAVEPVHAPWSVPVDVYFRRAASGWQLVGVERLPE